MVRFSLSLASVQVPEIDAAALQALPDESKEALLQRLLEQKLRSFASQVLLHASQRFALT
jgi:hypothetical protein